MKQRFEGRYKSTEDAHVLLLQLAQIKKEPSIPMRDFNEKFNKLIKRIPATSAPIGDNQKTFYISSMPPELGYLLRRANVATLQVTQTLAVEMEDDMIASGKWKKEYHTGSSSNTTSTSNSTEAMLQKLSNELITLKKQVTRPTHSLYQPYQEEPRYQGGNKNLQLPTPQQRLAIEAPPKGHTSCAFHLRVDHDGNTCEDMIRYLQMRGEEVQRIEYLEDDDDHAPHGDSVNLYCEYESDLENGENCFATLEGPQLTMMARGQKNKGKVPNAAPVKNQAPSHKANRNDNSASSSSQKEEKDKLSHSFDIIQFCEESKIQISPIDYLKSHPDQLQRLIDRCKNGGNIQVNSNVRDKIQINTNEGNPQDEDLSIPRLLQEKESMIHATCLDLKPEPFYVSLFINGNRLSNCIIDSGALDNVMLAPVAKALGFPLLEIFKTI